MVVLEHSVCLILRKFYVFLGGFLVSVQTRAFSIDTFGQMVVLYDMCKDVLFSGTEFQLWLLRVGDYVHFPSLIQMLMWPLENSLLVSLEAVNENSKMKEVGHVLCSVFEFIAKWSNRKVNAYWNLRASFAGADTVMRWSLSGPWLNICIIGFHEKRGDDGVSTWLCELF